MRIFTVVSEDQLFAELLEIGSAIFANAIGIDHASDRTQIPLFEFLYLAANFCNASDDLMTGHDWIVRRHEFAPLVANRMKVRVANPAEENFNLHIAIRGTAPRDCR